MLGTAGDLQPAISSGSRTTEGQPRSRPPPAPPSGSPGGAPAAEGVNRQQLAWKSRGVVIRKVRNRQGGQGRRPAHMAATGKNRHSPAWMAMVTDGEDGAASQYGDDGGTGHEKTL